MEDNFLQIVEEHAGRYPLMEPQDFAKLAYQSEFGPDHMIADREQAQICLIEEWRSLSEDSMPEKPEPVSESLCRFPLSACLSADAAGLLAELFFHTAGTHKGSMDGLAAKLEQLENMGISGMKEWIAGWRKNGCPPVHHSRTFRETYHPHYRLIQKEFADYFFVLLEIYKLFKKKNNAVIAIDGRCGSGKTYFAELIGTLFSCNICHMDDYYMPFAKRQENWMELAGGNMDFQRFLKEVLQPIKTGRQALYRPYHCKEDSMGESVKLDPNKPTVVEGSYSQHPALAREYDLKIFLTCGKEKQRRRLQKREGDYFPAFEEKWIPMEENYLRQYSIEEDSHFVADTGNIF